MMELWTVIGRILLDKSFHEEIFQVAKPLAFFEDLKDLRKVLRIKYHRALSRWEIMIINEYLTQNNIDISNPVILSKPDDDKAVGPIRNGWKGGSLSFPDDAQLCAVVGLCSMDIEYRKELYAVTNPTSTKMLESFLTNLAAETPIFALSALQLINLNNFMRYTDSSGLTMVELLYDYHIQKWIQPLVYPCNGGYTETLGTNYVYFAQSALVRVSELESDGKLMLHHHGVLFRV